MAHSFTKLLLSAALAVVIIGGPADAAAQRISVSGEKRISAKKAPASVVAAFRSQYPGARRVKYYIDRSETGGAAHVFWEMDFKHGGARWSVQYDSAGTLMEREERLTPEQLPGLVRTAMLVYLDAHYKKYKILTYEAVYTPETEVLYEVIIACRDADNYGEIEHYFDALGALVSVEKQEYRSYPTQF